jgi:hypothetical protein
MNINLVLATGLAYAFIGALIMFASHRSIYNSASRIVAGYPKVLAGLRAQRHDGRFGLIVLLCGSALQVCAALGYSAPLAYWRFPTCVVFGVIALYGIYRLIVAYRLTGAARRSERAIPPRIYESRRSRVLLEAARREAPNLLAREQARAPRDRSVILLAHEWECRWWSDKLGVSTDALKAAIRQVGPMKADIERHLRSGRQRRYALAA